MYRYETHLHTAPASKCARATVRESLEFYKRAGFDGVFITNHYLDGNLGMDESEPFDKRIKFYFDDLNEGRALAKEIGIKVFAGVELTYGGTDFLIYGIPDEWYAAHPEILGMEKTEELPRLMEEGALIIQAHPFREASYIDHIRLYPRHVHGVEIINACRKDIENEMARIYCEKYGLLPFAGSDNHVAAKRARLAGLEFPYPIESESEFIKAFLKGDGKIFCEINEEAEA